MKGSKTDNLKKYEIATSKTVTKFGNYFYHHLITVIGKAVKH